jgi:hypothetical protein
MEHSSFLERQRELLLRYLDGIAPQGIEPNAKEFCERVLDDWHQRYDTVALDAPEPVERTF